VRVAALYDVHGNLPALDAVLADARFQEADVVVCGGDLVAGPMPAPCFDRLDALGDRVRFVRGNGDRNVAARGAAYGGAWCAAELGPDRLAAVAAWPLTIELDVAGGATFCHATPRSDEEIVTRLTPDGELEEALADARTGLVVCGHTHVQVDRRLPGGRRLVNAGSVGRPYEGVRGAFWLLLDDREAALLRTDYDVEAAAAAIRASGYEQADDHAAELLAPSEPAEVSAYFESLRGA
jgi:predicted phosphodiesterase